MKKYIVKCRYNGGQIESTMQIYADSAEEARSEAYEYMVDSVVSVTEAQEYEEEAATFVNAIRTIAGKPENLENLELYLSHNFATWLEKYAWSPDNIAEELKNFAEMDLT